MNLNITLNNCTVNINTSKNGKTYKGLSGKITTQTTAAPAVDTDVKNRKGEDILADLERSIRNQNCVKAAELFMEAADCAEMLLEDVSRAGSRMGKQEFAKLNFILKLYKPVIHTTRDAAHTARKIEQAGGLSTMSCGDKAAYCAQMSAYFRNIHKTISTLILAKESISNRA